MVTGSGESLINIARLADETTVVETATVLSLVSKSGPLATTVAVVPTSEFCDVGATVTTPPTTAAAGAAPMTLAATTSGVASRAARAINRTWHRVLVRMDPSQDHSGGESARLRVPTGVKDMGDLRW